MQENKINCPCKRKNCERHGNCAECRLHHQTHTSYKGTYCDRQKKKRYKGTSFMDIKAPKPIAAPLLAWYDAHARVLPWRENPRPYRVWISEIMLQQTRVEAVKPYFDRFIRELPDIKSLAEVLKNGSQSFGRGWATITVQKICKKPHKKCSHTPTEKCPKAMTNCSPSPVSGLYCGGNCLHCLRASGSGSGRQCSARACPRVCFGGGYCKGKHEKSLQPTPSGNDTRKPTR